MTKLTPKILEDIITNRPDWNPPICPPPEDLDELTREELREKFSHVIVPMRADKWYKEVKEAKEKLERLKKLRPLAAEILHLP